MEQNKKKTTIIVVLLVVIILALVFFGYRLFWQSPVDQDVMEQAALKAEATKLNPFNEKQINPFEKNPNPYENIKTNPFE